MMEPKQKMQINGVYLEDTVTGYSTLEVSGREEADIDISTLKLDTVNGERYRRKRMETRRLRIRFMIRRDTPTQFLDSYRRLNYALSAEQAQLIFADEPDKYFIGTPEELSVDYPGQSVSTGTITIFCSDPYKYSLEEKEITASSGTASFNYDGTHPAYPVLEITANSNLGFAGAADDDGNVIQVGDPLEEGSDGTDKFDTEKSVTDVTSSPPTTSNGWTINALGGIDHASSNAFTQTGTVNTGTIEGKTAVKTNSWGSGSAWHGPSLCYTLATPSAKATLSWKMLCYASSNSQLGNFHAELRTASGGSIASISFYRNKKNSKTADIVMYVNGKSKKALTFTMDKTNTYTGTKGGICSIDKFGDTITFKFGSKVYTFTDAALADVTVGRAGFWFGRWASSTVLAANCVYNATVISHHVEKYEDVPNKFQTGDVITVDCGSGTVSVNGVEQAGIGALGNDYETFTLKPGVNNIAFTCSDWAASAPTYKVRYREAFI